jgi:hypothetical protein
VDRFQRSPRLDADARPIVAWVGRVKDAKQKDFARFSRIAAILAARGCRIWVVDGSAATLDDVAGAEFGHAPYDAWHTRLESSEMPELYQRVAASGGVVLMTSRYEGFPLVPLEAAASGAATIGPSVVGLREAILPETGALYPADATDADVATLVADWIATNPPSLALFERRAEAIASAFGVDDMVDRFAALYTRSAPLIAPRRAQLPSPLPAGATVPIETASNTGARHRAVWVPLARDLHALGEHRLALRAAAAAVRFAPAVLGRPREAASLVATTARAATGLLRRRA